MSNKDMTRKAFLKAGVAGTGAAIGAALPLGNAGALQEGSAAKKPEMTFRALGKTGLKVSEVCFGSYGFNNPGILEAALDAGINLVCTSHTYQRGNAERAIGEVMKKRRKDAYLLTGWRSRKDTKKAEFLKSLDESLEFLQTDHVDIIRAAELRDAEPLRNPELYEAFEEAKKAGKARFLGLSTHVKNLGTLLETAIDTGTIDVFLCKYNFMESPRQMDVFQKAAEKGIGIVVFKVGAGKRESEVKELQEAGATLRQARIKWALTNPNVSSVCAAFSNFDDVDENVGAVGKKLTKEDQGLLDRYAETFAHSYCRYCGTCEASCPYGVAVADVMRYVMYFKYYGHQKDAMQRYAELPSHKSARRCLDCDGYCLGACPHQLATRDNLLEAHTLLA